MEVCSVGPGTRWEMNAHKLELKEVAWRLLHPLNASCSLFQEPEPSLRVQGSGSGSSYPFNPSLPKPYIALAPDSSQRKKKSPQGQVKHRGTF